MKRTAVFLVLTFFVFSGSLLAIPSEGTFYPDKHHTNWGFQFNHIAKRDFNKVEGVGSTTHNFLAASYGVTDRFCLDGKVGVGWISFDRNDEMDMSFSSGFTGGYGFRYLLKKCEETNTEYQFGFQHISTHPFKREFDGSAYRVIWDEWQGSLLWIKRCPKISYYLGAQYSDVQLKYKVADFRRRLKTEDLWGLIVGVDRKIDENINLNLELRVVDELGANIGIMKKF